ncbi:hypothetical protein SAMN05216338_100261 [Bradyrhizobium sp. Rc2d]|uniref:hypothetical protein n=1 Tax=Bradyrhizobium sp. Rc2d TaxID=1855321 RepID=UPI0008880934|nr:hypothetical protein [Bradyrhizobium sp. Rc2d]SDG68039.1 hypothetical protein SAMN05216338_100261 [Bradyrhizobium sp. Rc2d]
MEGKDKITVLLAEYNSLGQEVIAARTNVGQGAGIFSAAFMANIALFLLCAKRQTRFGPRSLTG